MAPEFLPHAPTAATDQGRLLHRPSGPGRGSGRPVAGAAVQEALQVRAPDALDRRALGTTMTMLGAGLVAAAALAIWIAIVIARNGTKDDEDINLAEYDDWERLRGPSPILGPA